MPQFTDDIKTQRKVFCESLHPRSGELPVARLRHLHTISYRQDAGADIVTKTTLLYAAHADGVVKGVTVGVSTAPTGGDKLFTVDVKKGNSSDAFATILDSVVQIDDDNVDRETVVADLVASLSFATGDLFQVIITASGSTGSQGQGLVVNLLVDEMPE